MEWLNVILGLLSTATGIFLLLVLAGFIWATGKIEGYDSINKMFFRDHTTLGILESATPVTDNLSAFVSPLFE